MDGTSSRTGLVVFFVVAAIVGTVVIVATGPAEVGSVDPSRVWVFAAAAISASLVRRRSTGWPGSQGTFWLLGVIALASVIAIATQAVSNAPTSPPSMADVAYLVFLFPLVIAARGEFARHFEGRQLARVRADVALLALGLTALAYPFVRPVGAGAAASVTAFSLTTVAAAAAAIFLGLLIWVPSRSHVLLFFGYLPAAAAALAYGIARTHGDSDLAMVTTDILWFLAPLALGATMTLGRHEEAAPTRAPSRIARPLQASLSAVIACGAFAVVAIADDARGIAGTQSTLLFAALAIGIVLRIVTNQLESTQADVEIRTTLGRREAALVEADRTLERVREANETLRRSEEHLRLVFEAAVDGFVELDPQGTIVRTNDAFAKMVRLDVLAIEGQRWATLAASIDGVDEAFVDLPHGGEAQILRVDGPPLHLESRFSDLPTAPPRRLLLIRDVTAAKVSEQTIRSLFQFLQDRDEDRTRLLRRTNAAIEHERNRIARDLHDGPVQGVSAASLSLEAALLMLKAGDVDRGLDVLSTLRQEIANEAEALRRLMSGLRPPVLEERGLLPAIREMLLRFGEEQGIQTEFSGTMPRPLHEDLETLAYRIVQESLTNVAKHARAHHVSVRLDGDQNALRVEVEDDGVGFDTGQARDFLHEGRVGLASMRERVELASGTFAVRSTPARGTAVMATIPIDSAIVVATT